jgi:adenylate cyclase
VTQPAQAQRRRSTMVFADLVESDRLMRQHEASAIERWREFVAQARTQVLPASGVLNVRMGGDALLMEFADAPAALQAAFALHRCVEGCNQGVAEADTMRLRMGVHTADVVVDEYEAYGIGVNFAARLAALAAPAQTLVSDVVRSALVDGVHAQLVDLGERYVKHLLEPVRVFAAHAPGSTEAAAHRVPFPSADDLLPVVAVVPFVAMPADATHDALGHAMADEVIATLARHGGLRVLSRVTTAALRGTDLDLPSLRKLLGASYLLTGRFYAQADRVRLSVELCDLRNGDVLWTGSSQADVQALFAGQDDLIPHVASNVSQRVMASELTRVRSLPMDTLASYTLFLGATGLMHSLVRGDFERAQPMFEHLIERHPRQAAPHAAMSRWHVFRHLQGWTTNVDEATRFANDHASRAMDIDPSSSQALTAIGLMRLHVGTNIADARRYLLDATAADPQDALAWAYLAGAHSNADEHSAGVAAAHQAICVSPMDPNLFLLEAFSSMAHIAAGSYADAAVLAKSSIRHHLLHAPSHRLLVAALWLSGETEKAKSAAQDFLSLHPQTKVTLRKARLGVPRPSWAGRVDGALLDAGIPLA